MKNKLKTFLKFSLVLLISFGALPVPNAFAAANNDEIIWTLSGYLPENPSQKVFIKIRGRKIVQILKNY